MTSEHNIVSYEAIRDSAYRIIEAQANVDNRTMAELAIAILLNKPVILVVPADVTLSPKLRLVADEIVAVPAGCGTDWDIQTRNAVRSAVLRIMGRGLTSIQ